MRGLASWVSKKAIRSMRGMSSEGRDASLRAEGRRTLALRVREGREVYRPGLGNGKVKKAKKRQEGSVNPCCFLFLKKPFQILRICYKMKVAFICEEEQNGII